MVRLLQYYNQGGMCHDEGFNPTMVRLLHRLPCRHTKPGWRFQSHYGAIATGHPAPFPSDLARVSIPLWCDCYLAVNPAKPTALHGFNPTMVRLLQASMIVEAWGSIRFNPTMVRLLP